MIDYAKANLRAGGDRRIQLVRACVVVVLSIERLTTARLGADAPPISRLRETLLGMERALLELTVTREPDAVPQQDPAQTRGTDDTAQPKNAGSAALIPSNEIPPADTAQPDAANQLSRRIEAICKATGIHEPSGAERLMAMQVGLLHDQNRILQRVAKDAAGEDFTSLIDAVVRGMSAAR